MLVIELDWSNSGCRECSFSELHTAVGVRGWVGFLRPGVVGRGKGWDERLVLGSRVVKWALSSNKGAYHFKAMISSFV
jgi:hypothetical protein